MVFDLLNMLYTHSAKKEAQQSELLSFTTFAFLFWDSLVEFGDVSFLHQHHNFAMPDIHIVNNAILLKFKNRIKKRKL